MSVAVNRLLAVAGLAVLLAACGFTEVGSRARDIAANEGAKAYDEGLANAEFFLCRAASVGSVQRRYGRTAETARAWRTLCLGDGEAAVEVIREPAPPKSEPGSAP
ncbi:MAG: hypothetical protein R3285_00850 [Kiloniellales bacterium]|nr:hypothetical protein [Kiloniellales bacterium]